MPAEWKFFSLVERFYEEDNFDAGLLIDGKYSSR